VGKDLKPKPLVQLQEMCMEKHISIDGNAEQLVKRLLIYDEEMRERQRGHSISLGVEMKANVARSSLGADRSSLGNNLKTPLIDDGV
jgi:hypothetical protein